MGNVKFGKIEFNPNHLAYEKIGDNKWKINHNLECSIETKKGGRFVYNIKPGVTTDFRSGPSIVDHIAPKIGICDISMSWLIHDINYFGYLPKDLSDSLLYTMLRRTGLDKWRCQAVYIGVTLFGPFGYKQTKDKEHIDFFWLDGNNKSNNRKLSEVPPKVRDCDNYLSFRRENCECVLEALKDFSKDSIDPDEVKKYYR